MPPSTSRVLPFAVIAAIGAAAPLAAQLPRFHPPKEPAWYQGIESQTLYFVRGSDTTRMTGTAPRVARLTWVPGRHGDALVVATTALDVTAPSPPTRSASTRGATWWPSPPTAP